MQDGAGSQDEKLLPPPVSPPVAPSMPSPPSPPYQNLQGAEGAGAEALSVGGEDSDTAPLPERLVAKDWKVRKAAMEALAAQFSSGAASFDEYGASPARFQRRKRTSDDLLLPISAAEPLLPKLLDDKNASCLDAALDAAMAFAEHCPSAAKSAEAVAPPVVANGFAARAVTAGKSEALLLKLMEVGTPEAVVLSLIDGLSNKKPKVPPFCVTTITAAARAFGGTTLPLKELRGALPGMLEHKVVAVRSAAMELLVELLKWVGKPPLQGIVDSLRGAQQSEFETAAEGIVPGQAIPTTYLKSQRPAAGGGSSTSDSASPAPALLPTFDARDMVEAVDLMAKLGKTDFKAKMDEEKWSEKVGGMQIAIDLIGPLPKLVPGADYGDLVKLLRELGGHSHVQVVCTSFKLLGMMAQGLRKDFTPYARGVFKTMLLKLTDKKCLRVAEESMGEVYTSCMTVEPICEDLVTGLDAQKVNAVHARASLYSFISRFVCPVGAKGVDPGSMGSLMRACLSSVADSDPKIRDACCEAAAAIATLVGPKGGDVSSQLSALKNSNARAHKKISDLMGASGTSPAAGPEQPAAPPAVKPSSPSAAAAASRSPPSAAAARPRPRPKPSAKAAEKSEPGSTKPASSKAGAAAGGGASLEGPEEGVSGVDLSPEDALEQLSGMGLPNWDSEIVPGWASAKWQDRKAAFDAVASSASDLVTLLPAVVVVCSHHTKKFKESNFNVLKAALDLVTAVLDAAESVEKSVLVEVLPIAVEKLGDRKLNECSSALLMASCECAGTGFVVSYALRTAASSLKSPVAIDQFTSWLVVCISDFGAGSVPVKKIAAYSVGLLEHSNPKVRTSAMEVLASLYSFMGPPLRTLLPDSIKPATQSLLDAQFEKSGFDPAAAASRGGAKRVVKGAAAADAGGSGGSSDGGLPRADIMSLIDRGCLKDMDTTAGKDSWKGRKAAIETVLSACEKSGHYLDAGKGAQAVIKALKGRLSDSQSNLKPMAAGAIAEVVSSLPDDAAPKYCRLFAEALISCVADNRKLMRDAAISAFEAIVVRHPLAFEPLIPYAAAGLSHPVGRQEMLEWALKHLNQPSEASGTLVAPLLLCMQDKQADVRKLAEDCLVMIVAMGGATSAQVKAGTRDFQPAALRSMQAGLLRIYDTPLASSAAGGAGESAPPPPAPAGPAPSSPSAAAHAEKDAMPSVGGAAGGNKKQSTLRRPSSRSKVMEAGPGEVTEAINGSASVAVSLPRNPGGKSRRAETDRRQRWLVSSDEPSDVAEKFLRDQWSPLLDAAQTSKLFPAKSGSMECGSDGVALLSGALEADSDSYMDHLDLIFKWFSLRLCEKENVQALQALLDLLVATLEEATVSKKVALSDQEAEVLLPTLLEKSGQSKERFRLAVRRCLALVSEAYPHAKYAPMALSTAGSTKNFRSRSACLEEVARVLGASGLTVVGKKGLKELGKFVDAREAEVRAAALDALAEAYVRMDYDLGRLHKFVGDVPSKARGLIDERMRQMDKRKAEGEDDAPTPEAPPPAPSATPAKKVKEVEDDVDRDLVRPASLESLKLDSRVGELTPGGPAMAHYNALPLSGMDDDDDDGGPFKFNADELQVPALSPNPVRRPGRTLPSRVTAQPEAPPQEPVAPKESPSPANHALTAATLAINELLKQPLPLNPKVREYAEAKDQIKAIYHLAAEGSGPDRDALRASPGSVIAALVKCLSTSFRCAPPKGPGDEGLGGIDMPLLSTSLAALMAIVREMSSGLTMKCVTSIVETSCGHLMDTRLSESGEEATPYKEAAPQVVRALNKLAIAAVEGVPAPMALAALLQSLAHSTLPAKVMKMEAKLMTKVMKKEGDSASPFRGTDLATILPVLQVLLVDSSPSENSTPGKSVAQSLWQSLIQAFPRADLVRAMNAAGVPDSSVLHQLLPPQPQRSQEDLSAEVAGLIQKVSAPSGQDSSAASAAMKQLYAFSRAHPEVDLAAHLSHLSGPFQAFIMGQLDHIRKSEAAPGTQAALRRSVSGRASVDDDLAGIGSAAGAEDPNKRLAYLKTKLRGGHGAIEPAVTAARRSSSSSSSGASKHDLSSIRMRLKGTAAAASGSAPAGSSGNTEPAAATTSTSTNSLKERLAAIKKQSAVQQQQKLG